MMDTLTLWQRLLRYRPARWAWRFLRVLVVIAMLANLLANDKPLYCQLDGAHYFPAFREYAVDLGWMDWPAGLSMIDWKEAPYEQVLRAPVPYSPRTLDLANNDYVSPFAEQRVPDLQARHWLGTDQLGRDVLSNMIYGARSALLVGLGAMLLAALIGGFFGVLAGYFGDRSVRLSRWSVPVLLLGVFFAWFYGFRVRRTALLDGGAGQWLLSLLLAALILALSGWVARWLHRRFPGSARIYLPLDALVLRLIEVLSSIPALLLLLTLVAVLERNGTVQIILIIGLIGWTGIARYLRAELLRIRVLPYVEAARALGFSNQRIIARHALPNALTPVLITLSFGVAAAILVEAALSFLGLGIANGATWGSLLAGARSYFPAWWMAVFPGVAIFLTVVTFNLLGEGLSRAMDPGR